MRPDRAITQAIVELLIERIGSGSSPRDAARHTGLSLMSIYHWLDGTQSMSLQTATAIADAMGVHLADLLRAACDRVRPEAWPVPRSETEPEEVASCSH